MKQETKNDLRAAWRGTVPVLTHVLKMFGLVACFILWMCVNYLLLDSIAAVLVFWLLTAVCLIFGIQYAQAKYERERVEREQKWADHFEAKYGRKPY